MTRGVPYLAAKVSGRTAGLRPWVAVGALGAVLMGGGGMILSAADAAGGRVFAVSDHEVLNPVTSGRVRVVGALDVRFVGRIQPHEESVYSFFGPNVAAIAGTFARVVLPAGWRGDVSFDAKARSLTRRNLRPSHAPAFPGAEGFGKSTVGGRGGKVHEVTNLNDAGPGRFRAAVLAKGPRTVVFRLSGTIALESELKIRAPFLTIAGQTAPGDGICLKNYQVNFDPSQVIMRYLRIRPGDEKGQEQDGFGGGSEHIVVDRGTASWGADETFSINKAANLTVQWCLLSESLYRSLHKQGNHSYGGPWGGPGGSWPHNILAHHSSRHPRTSGMVDSGLMDYRNNVSDNWGFNSAYGGELWPRNWINNYDQAGPATDDTVRRRIFLQKDPWGKMDAAGKFVAGFPAIRADPWKGGIDFATDGEATEKTLRVDRSFVVAPVTTHSAEQTHGLVLAQAGASRERDALDRRVIEEIRTGTAKFGAGYKGGGKVIIDSQRDVGGWPELRSLPAPADTDYDGVPNVWVQGQGLNPPGIPSTDHAPRLPAAIKISNST